MDKGKVYLVGAGPGHEGLITRRGSDLVKAADVLVYDRLVGSNILLDAKDTCEMIYVGKKSADHTMRQEDINQLLVDKAKEDKLVVRLKGGDPYVFGRGGEEVIKLNQHQVPFEVVPGISSSIGGLCYAGIPITHRGVATSFHIITGHFKDDETEHDWGALARLQGTLVFLMGMSNLKKITDKLIAHDKPKDTPAAVVHWASHPNQVVVEGTLDSLYDKVQAAGVSSPSLIVIGDVVALRKELSFFENQPLHGVQVAVTRASQQASGLIDRIRSLGGQPIALPMIDIKALDPKEQMDHLVDHMASYQYLVFTSVNGVKRFFQELDKRGRDSRILHASQVVCIGQPTADVLRDHGIRADVLPNRAVAEGLLDTLRPLLKQGDRVLVPRAKNARPLLVEELDKICQVEEVHLYESQATNQVMALEDFKKIQVVTFTSASTVKHFMKAYGHHRDLILEKDLVSIGPITSQALRDFDLPVKSQAKVHTIDGLVEALKDLYGGDHDNQ